MTSSTTEPIHADWTPSRDDSAPPSVAAETTVAATAGEVNHELARFEVASIGPTLVPHLAAAAAELALLAGIPWRFSTDDAPVALLRIIAKVAITTPAVGGPHTARLLTQLQATD